MQQRKILPEAQGTGSLSPTKPQGYQDIHMEEDGRDANRLNAQGLAYSGYHLNHDAGRDRQQRATGGMA